VQKKHQRKGEGVRRILAKKNSKKEGEEEMGDFLNRGEKKKKFQLGEKGEGSSREERTGGSFIKVGFTLGPLIPGDQGG